MFVKLTVGFEAKDALGLGGEGLKVVGQVFFFFFWGGVSYDR